MGWGVGRFFVRGALTLFTRLWLDPVGGASDPVGAAVCVRSFFRQFSGISVRLCAFFSPGGTRWNRHPARKS